MPQRKRKPKGDESAPRPSRRLSELIGESRRLIQAGEDTIRKLKQLTSEIAEDRAIAEDARARRKGK